MRLCYRALIGRRVFDAGGSSIGRVADLVAEQRGDALCVTALLLGPAAFVRRIGFKRTSLGSSRLTRIPWERVVAVNGRIVLRSDEDAAAMARQVIGR